jgi:hypothetical protein
MSFQIPITVKEAVDNVHAKKYRLPAIQRELVWDSSQIESLFDSLMRDYPVGSFWFWQVDKRKTQGYQFYEFLRDYHERDSKHNPKADVTGEDDVTAILDGQQRLTSLYIGLPGSYAEKERMKRWDNNAAFPPKRLPRYSSNHTSNSVACFSVFTRQGLKTHKDYHTGRQIDSRPHQH